MPGRRRRLSKTFPIGRRPPEAMLEAMQDQLGIKLKPARAIVSVLVIDHVEQPTEN